MARLTVNPTRMELRRLKARLKTASRGHKLLKDKSDEMVRQFMVLIKRNKTLREEVETELSTALNGFMLARAMNFSSELESAIAVPSIALNLTVSSANLMGVEVPKFSLDTAQSVSLPYSYQTASIELDSAIAKLTATAKRLLELAEIEKSCNMLADEIEKNRRRVNALEYVLIPQLNETIKYIVMKLDENERGNLIRLMKVKELINKEAANV